MDSIRTKREALEDIILSSYGKRAAESKGRAKSDPPCGLRTCFQRDIDRITYCKSFRRLKHKTQVFLQPEGDHYRTRLTHTIEVVRISRTIARALALNEDLAEAAALGHDLGHTPFGHAGERVLNELYPGGFYHAEQSLRVVDKLENAGEGLNLTWEVRQGILNHGKICVSDPLECQILRYADRIAYLNHDADDAIRAKILKSEDIPDEITHVLGEGSGMRIDTLIRDIVEQSQNRSEIRMSPEVYFLFESLRNFMFERVYANPIAKGEEIKVSGMLMHIYEYYTKHPEKLPEDYNYILEDEGLDRAVCDYISGMSDKFAIDQYSLLFIPSTWQVR